MKKILLSLTLILGSPLALAEYTFNNVALSVYQDTVEVLDGADDFKGTSIGISATHELENQIYIVGGYSSGSVDLSEDTAKGELEYSAIGFGAGKYFEVGSGAKIAITAQIAMVDQEFTITDSGFTVINEKDDDSGLVLSLDYIVPASDVLDFNIGVTRSEIADGSTSFSAALSYDIADNISLGWSYGQGDDSSSIGVSLRLKTD